MEEGRPVGQRQEVSWALVTYLHVFLHNVASKVFAFAGRFTQRKERGPFDLQKRQRSHPRGVPAPRPHLREYVVEAPSQARWLVALDLAKDMGIGVAFGLAPNSSFFR